MLDVDTVNYPLKISSFKKPFHLLKIYLAKQYTKLYPSEMFVGVAGSVGKTSCIRCCVAVLSRKHKTLSTKPNFDSILNISETLLKLNPSIKKVLLEMGVGHKGEMDFYLAQVQPKIVILTKVSYDHSETLGDINEILQEYSKLIVSLPKDGLAIVNWDDLNSRKLALDCKGEVIYYGTDPQRCTVWAGNLRIENLTTTFELNLGVERVKVNYRLLGAHQVYPALAAATLGVAFGIPLTKIKLALETIEPMEHYLQALQGPNGSVILDDAYNCSPVALDASIDTLLAVPARRRVIVLGQMQELGEYSQKLHREVGQRIYKEKLDLVFLGQGDTQFIADELKSLGFWEERFKTNLQNSQLVSTLLKTLGKGDVCLIKGSRSVRLDEVVKRIVKK